MRLLERMWSAVTYVTSILTLSGVENPTTEVQSPLFFPSNRLNDAGPIFRPPTGTRGDEIGVDFTCDYSKMVGWHYCSTPENRHCWLRNDKTGEEFNTKTNYEKQAPLGIHRTYYLDLVDNSTLNADGIIFPFAKLLNNIYPGPWLQACWGDTVTVIVKNKLKHNGTSIHWHGIRQNQTMHMDGVNGVTQCPVAPQDTFNYTWNAIQYGSSWYHSHYSAQYADGVQAPMTLHGPSTAPYDEAKLPLIMTDWGHESAFKTIYGKGLYYPSILLNGVGNVTRYNNSVSGTNIPEPYWYHFNITKPGERAVRYLLRLINTSFDSTFVFSIDHHRLQIVGADFVPIHPYMNNSVLVGIGQRYHVIVEANPEPDEAGNLPPADGNFWMRTYKANCFGFVNPTPSTPGGASLGYEKAGVIRYDADSKTLPTSFPWKKNVSLDCSDETYDSLVPYLPWKVGPAVNAPNPHEIGEHFAVQFDFKGKEHRFPLGRMSMAGEDFNPLQIQYDNPTFLHLDYNGKLWDPLWAVTPEEYNEDSWIYMVIRGRKGIGTPGAHPIHLHGHDFALLQQMSDAVYPFRINLKLDNPPRRDVVLLPAGGYVVIAFKADNPGAWLMHCHIADHASFGLALQVMERQSDANATWPIWPPQKRGDAINNAIDTCNKWRKWAGDCDNWWPKNGTRGSSCPEGESGFGGDSGI